MSECAIYKVEWAFMLCKVLVTFFIGFIIFLELFDCIMPSSFVTISEIFNFHKLGRTIKIIFLYLFEKKFCSLNIMCKFAIPNRKRWCWFGSSAG